MSTDNSRSLQIRHSFYLLLATFFWGTTFVAQSIAMDTIEPYTYNASRFFVGAAALLPFAILTGRLDPLAVNYKGTAIPDVSRPEKERWHNLLLGGLLVGICLFFAGSFQQVGLVYTTAGKSGFVTALYIVFVPVLGFLFFKKKCSPMVIVSIVIALIGFYLLCIKEGFSINKGDLITLGSSVMFAMHILTVDHFNPKVNGVQLSCAQFVVAGLLSLIPAFLIETPSWSAVFHSIGPILYAGILSSAGGYTLQIIGQRGLNPTIASLLMSFESVISALSGWIVLGDVLSPKEITGCCLVFAGIILAQLPAPHKKASKKLSAD